MDVGIGGIGFEGRHKRVEVLRDDVLSRDRYDVGLCPRACHSAAIHRAGLWRWDPCWGCQIGAEEHEDAAGIARLAEMDMSLRHRACLRRRGADIRVSQLVGDGAGLLIEIERAVPVPLDRTAPV